MFKKTIQAAGFLVALAVFSEIVIAGFHAYRTGEIIYFRDSDAGTIPAALTLPGAVFQPYFGYTLRAGRTEDYLDEGPWKANNFGFQTMEAVQKDGCCDYPYRPSDDEFVVGVFGGSVGSGFAMQAQADGSLAKALAKVERVGERRVTVLNFSHPGFRQPQQLTTLAYFLSIGQTFDLVVNIDGFNEIVTSWRNHADGVEFSYPADTLWGAWGRQLDQQKVPVSDRLFHRANFHTLSARAAREHQTTCWSAWCFYLAEARAVYHDWRAGSDRARLSGDYQDHTLFPTKSVSVLPEPFDVHAETARVWRRASAGMARLAEASGAEYVHILQPNQWFTEAGSYEPIKADHIYQWVIDPVNTGYPLFRQNGADLARQNVAFLDATLVFKDVPDRQAYVDDCCHYTPGGYRILFEALAKYLQSRPRDGRQARP